MRHRRTVAFGVSLLLSIHFLFAGEEGPRWRPKDASPGVKFELKESNRMKVSGKTVVFYRMESASFPEGKKYSLYLWNFGQPFGWVMMKDFTVDAGGRLMCAHPIPPEVAEKGNRACVFDLEKLELRAIATEKGVPFRAAIISEDQEVKAFARAVPLPIESRQGGCLLSAEVASDDFGYYLIQGEGFAPGETVDWSARTKGLSQEDQAIASSDGKFVVELHPGASPAAAGKVVFTASGKSCSPTLIFRWGKKRGHEEASFGIVDSML